MRITEDQKQKYLSYLKTKGLPEPKNFSDEIAEMDIITAMVDDAHEKTIDNSTSPFLIFEWMFARSVVLMEESLSEEEVRTLSSSLDSDSISSSISSLFTHQKHAFFLFQGFAYAYCEYCFSQNAEPNENIMNQTEIFFIALHNQLQSN